MTPENTALPESMLIERAKSGDRTAIVELVEPWRKPLFRYIYRMVTLRADTDDLYQDVMVRVLEGVRTYRGEAPFKSWLFGIATHVCLDHLRSKNRWRVETQLLGEKHAVETGQHDFLVSMMAQPDFQFEIREHIAFCFACIGRTLPPEEQAALLLREMLGFSGEESAKILSVSEPVFRHRLAAARAAMIEAYSGLCQLINKTGLCYQCAGLRAMSPDGHRGMDLVAIQVVPGKAVTPENLFDARLEIARQADLEDGRTRPLHDLFFNGLTQQEQNRA